MGAFTKSTVNTKATDVTYDDYQAETARVDTDFTINTLKNVHKNHKLKTNVCRSYVIIEPNSVNNYTNVVIYPESSTCMTDVDGDGVVDVVDCFSPTLVIAPNPPEDACARRNIIGPGQVPFVLAARGILFRERSTPYFTTNSNAEAYISDD